MTQPVREAANGSATAEDVAAVEAVARGDVGAVARLIRDLEENVPHARTRLALLQPQLGCAHVVGITGAPGVGKSTLIDQLITGYRARGDAVGVIAVDPSSPFGGGAILGDRVRMRRHATDVGVFIRSLATRGHLGGLSSVAADTVAVLDAAGKDVVIVETVGTGQSEVEIMDLAHTVVLVDAPGLGDEIQAIKAGVLEIADVIVVNKADLSGADDAIRYLTAALRTRSHDRRVAEVVKAEAARSGGISEALAAIDRHREHLHGTGRGEVAGRRRVSRFHELLVQTLQAEALRWLESTVRGDELLRGVAAGEIDPCAAARCVAAEKFALPAAAKRGGRV